MSNSLLRTDKEIAEIYTRHSKTVYRVCFAYMKNPADTEDAVQDTFFQLIKSGPAFESEEHEKAWLIRVATNLCKNQLRSWWRRHEDLEDYKELIGTEDQEDQYTDLKYALMRLPDKYKTVVVLYYYEDYKSEEIANILGKPASTIRNYLCDARIILKKYLEESEDG